MRLLYVHFKMQARCTFYNAGFPNVPGYSMKLFSVDNFHLASSFPEVIQPQSDWKLQLFISSAEKKIIKATKLKLFLLAIIIFL